MHGSSGRQTALRERCSYALPCEAEDSRFSSASQAGAVASLRSGELGVFPAAGSAGAGRQLGGG